MIGIIGGSGFEKFDQFEIVERLDTNTPFGHCSSGLVIVNIDGINAIFMPRHGQVHEHLPNEVNYKANIFALKQLGVQTVISFSAVGSLKQELKPGDLVFPNQYIDYTKSPTVSTFCGDGVVGHVSLAHPICEQLNNLAQQLSANWKFDCHSDQTYICIDGPRFSTKAESKLFIQFGATLIGMTNLPEAALVREAGLCYLPCCFITDYDCWNDNAPHVTVDEVLKIMRQNNHKAFEVLQHLVKELSNMNFTCNCATQGLVTGLMTPEHQIPKKHKSWLNVITGDQ